MDQFATTMSPVRSVTSQIHGDPQYRIIKNWMNLWRNHLIIEAGDVNKIQPNKPPQHLKIQIQNISNISYHKDKDAQIEPKIILSATLFNTQRKKFFGRTYKSHPIGLEFIDEDQLYKLDHPVSMYFHSQVVQSEHHVCVIEATINDVHKKNQYITKTKVVGFAIFPCFKITKPKTTQFYNGSVMFLLQYNIEELDQLNEVLTYKVEKGKGFQLMENLIPDSTLCGWQDTVPGILGGKMPNDLGKGGVKLYEPLALRIDQIKIQHSANLHNWILRYSEQIRNQKFQIEKSDKNIQDCTIREIKLYIIGHNTWTAVNSKKFSNYIILSESQKTKNTLEFNGQTILENIFSSDFLLLGFSLQYEIELPYQNNKKDYIRLNLGWLPVIINDEYRMSSEVFVGKNMLLAPGKNIWNKQLFDFENNASSSEIMLMCRIQYPKEADYFYDTDIYLTQKRINQFAPQTPNYINQVSEMGEQQQEEYRPQTQDQQYSQQVDPHYTESYVSESQRYEQDKQYQHPQNVSYMKYSQQNFQQPQWKQQHQQQQQQQQQGQDMQYRQNYEKRRIYDYHQGQIEDTKEIQQRMGEYGEIDDQFKDAPEQIRTMIQKNRKVELDQLRELEFLRLQIEDTKKRTEEYQKDLPVNLIEKMFKEEPDLIDMPILTKVEPDEKTEEKESLGKLIPDKIFFDKLGLKGILDEQKLLQSEENIELELKSQFQKNLIEITFMKIKPTEQAIYYNAKDSFSKSESYHGAFTFPKKFFFKFQFFDFEETQTGPITYAANDPTSKDEQKNSSSEYQFHTLFKDTLRKNKEKEISAKTKFTFDPSSYKSKDKLSILYFRKEFIKYLHARILPIDIFSYDQQLYYGTIRLKLSELFIQEAQVKEIHPVVQIYDFVNNQIKGEIQVKIKNTGQIMKDIAPGPSQKATHINERVIKSSQSKQVSAKHHVKCLKSLDVPKNFEEHLMNDMEYIEVASLNPQKRKQERIHIFRQKQKQNNLKGKKKNQPDDYEKDLKNDRNQNLRRVQKYKENKKNYTLNQIIKSVLTNEITIMPRYGEAEIIAFQFENSSESEKVFAIRIDDMDKQFLETPELKLIRDPEEWKYLVQTNPEYLKPPDYNLIKKQNVFILEAKQSCIFLFKFRTLRKKRSRSQLELDKKLLDTEIYKEYNHHRMIRVIFHEKGKQMMAGLKINVTPVEGFPDHRFKYYEQEQTFKEISLPCLYYQSEIPDEIPVFEITYKKAIINSEKINNPTISLKILSAGSCLKFNILIYKDKFKLKLLQTWEMEIFSLSAQYFLIHLLIFRIDTFVELGQPSLLTIPFFCMESKNLKCSVSQPLLAQLDQQFEKEFQVVGGTTTEVQVKIRSLRLEPQNFILNCFDNESKDIQGMWLIRVITSVPTISKIQKVNCKINHTGIIYFKYRNKLPREATYTFVTSHAHYCKLTNPILSDDQEESSRITLLFEKGETKTISGVIAQQNREGVKEICVFITDEEEMIFENYLFKINYRYSE